jgi:ABC-type antimicrobial peptide transport system permease subunit
MPQAHAEGSFVVVLTVNFADAILTEAGLTFVGLGLPISTPDWGWEGLGEILNPKLAERV